MIEMSSGGLFNSLARLKPKAQIGIDPFNFGT